jgi:hypothetical protein
MIYSNVNHQRGGWVGLKKSKTWRHNTWMVPYLINSLTNILIHLILFWLFLIKINNLSISEKWGGRFIQGGMYNLESRIHGKNQKMRQTSLCKHSCLLWWNNYTNYKKLFLNQICQDLLIIRASGAEKKTSTSHHYWLYVHGCLACQHFDKMAID